MRRVALGGANLGGFGGSGGLGVTVNGQKAGTIVPTSTDALRYNTDKSVWQERTLTFAAALMKHCLLYTSRCV